MLDLSAMPLAELKQLEKHIARTISGYDARKKAEARAQLEAKAKEFGFSLAELTGTEKRTRRAAAPKYRHPENPAITWTGRGRKPKWFAEYIAAGKPLEKLEL